MSRTILDDGLNTWEIYATSGDFGYADPARIVFRCLTDSGERARAVELGGDKSEAEGFVVERSDEELRELLGKAEPVD